MFDIKKFIMNTLKEMKGNYPNFQIKEFALNWYEKGKLTENDLAELEEHLTLVEEETTDYVVDLGKTEESES